MKQSTADEPIVLAVTGMTCAACAARIEKKLNRLDGVVATVNYATSKATVHSESVPVERLVDTIEELGYGAVAPTPSEIDAGRSTVEIANEAHVIDIGRRLRVAVVGAAPVLLVSMIGSLQFDGWQWVALVLSLPVVTWCARPFHRAAWRNLRHRATTMDTLVSLGVIAAMAWSLWALVFGGAGEIGMRMNMSLFPRSSDSVGHAHGSTVHHEIYLEVATTLVAFLLAGRYFEVRSKSRAGAALRALADLHPRSATLWRDGTETTVPIAALGVGELFLVRPGEKVATDGVVVEGASAVDSSLVTGESVPIEVETGDVVTGGTLNTTGRLVVRATRIGRDTVLAHMARLVERAQDSKAPVQRLADRVSSVFVPFVISLSVVTLVVWLVVSGDTERSFQAAVSVLVIACPCALGLATPVALLVGTSRAAREGVIITGAEVLESTRAVDLMILDKTGTITTGEMSLDLVDEIVPGHLALVAAVEAYSEHPVARAIVRGLDGRGIDRSAITVTDFENSPGLGVRASARGHVVEIRRATAEHEGTIEAFVDGAVVARFSVHDEPKPDSAAAIADIRDLGIRPMIVSGDAPTTVRRIADAVGIAPVDAVGGVLPADKVAIVERLRSEGHVVAMVGDGVNDAAALVAADLGIAMGTGTDAAMQAGDLTIVSGKLSVVPRALALSRRTLRIIRANLFWAFAYNVAALPLAVAGLMNPVLAGLAMALSSVFVVANSLRLRS